MFRKSFTPDGGYDEARLAWNRKVVQYPAVIVAVETVSDAQTAVNFARRHNLGVAVQSTGHGNVRPADDCLLILTQEMNHVTIDPVGRTAAIEAGVQWGVVLAAAQEVDLAPLSVPRRGWVLWLHLGRRTGLAGATNWPGN